MGYYPNSTLGVCKKCENKFNSGCVECNENECLKCNLNYLHPISKNCSTTCPSTYFSNDMNHKCTLCSSSYNNGCEECN